MYTLFLSVRFFRLLSCVVDYSPCLLFIRVGREGESLPLHAILGLRYGQPPFSFLCLSLSLPISHHRFFPRIVSTSHFAFLNHRMCSIICSFDMETSMSQPYTKRFAELCYRQTANMLSYLLLLLHHRLLLITNT